MFVLNWLTRSKWQIRYRETSVSSVTQEIGRVLWNCNVHSRVKNSKALVPKLSHISLLHALLDYFFTIHFVSPHIKAWIVLVMFFFRLKS